MENIIKTISYKAFLLAKDQKLYMLKQKNNMSIINVRDGCMLAHVAILGQRKMFQKSMMSLSFMSPTTVQLGFKRKSLGIILLCIL